MKKDWKLWAAITVLIGLVIVLLIISLDRLNQVEKLTQEIQSIKTQPAVTLPKVLNGYTPVLGIDYFNGSNATDEQVKKAVDGYMAKHPIKDGTSGLNGSNGDNAYDLAVKNGFTGTIQEWLDSLKVKGDKGDAASELDIDCKDGHIVKRYVTDAFWQTTNIKCEVDSE